MGSNPIRVTKLFKIQAPEMRLKYKTEYPKIKSGLVKQFQTFFELNRIVTSVFKEIMDPLTGTFETFQ